MDTFQSVAIEHKLQCEINWWGYVGGFFHYNYHAFCRPLDKKVEYLAQAILNKTLHQDALLFTNKSVLEKLQNSFENKAVVDKTKFVQYIGYAYTHSKKGPFTDILEKVGMVIYQSMRRFCEQAAGERRPSESVVDSTRLEVQGLPPPLRSLTVLFPENLYAIFSLKRESSQEEKEAFIAKNFEELPPAEKDLFVAQRESLATNESQFFEFLKVFYAHLVERCFGGVVEIAQDLPLMTRVKKIQEWIREHAKEVTTSLAITIRAGYLPWREISAYENISSLDISKNGITEIPDCIGKFRNLQSLDVRFNEIKTISPEIQKCTQLKEVFFDHNKLSKIPKELWLHPAIKHLSFSGNQIKILPQELPEKEDLFINVSDNPIETCKRSLLEKQRWSVHIPQETQVIEDI